MSTIKDTSETQRLKVINAQLLTALRIAQELLERNGIERDEIATAIAAAEGRS